MDTMSKRWLSCEWKEAITVAVPAAEDLAPQSKKTYNLKVAVKNFQQPNSNTQLIPITPLEWALSCSNRLFTRSVFFFLLCLLRRLPQNSDLPSVITPFGRRYYFALPIFIFYIISYRKNQITYITINKNSYTIKFNIIRKKTNGKI